MKRKKVCECVNLKQSSYESYECRPYSVWRNCHKILLKNCNILLILV